MTPTLLSPSPLAISPATIAALNDQSQLFDQFQPGQAASLRPGAILAANDANFEAGTLSEPLSEYIVGESDDEGLREALDIMAPVIPCGKAFTYRTHSTKEQYLLGLEANTDVRQIGGDFSRSAFGGDGAEARTYNKGLIMVLDDGNGGDEEILQQRAALQLRNHLLRLEIGRALVALNAASVNVDKTWSSGTPDCDLDVRGANTTGGTLRGIDGNVVVWGKGAWEKRTTAHRGGVKAGDIVSAAQAADSAARLCGARRGVELSFRYSSSADFQQMLDNTVFAYHAESNAVGDDPSNIKRFAVPLDGGYFRVHLVRELKKRLVCVEHYSTILAASTLGIRKLTIS